MTTQQFELVQNTLKSISAKVNSHDEQFTLMKNGIKEIRETLDILDKRLYNFETDMHETKYRVSLAEISIIETKQKLGRREKDRVV